MYISSPSFVKPQLHCELVHVMVGHEEIFIEAHGSVNWAWHCCVLNITRVTCPEDSIYKMQRKRKIIECHILAFCISILSVLKMCIKLSSHLSPDVLYMWAKFSLLWVHATQVSRPICEIRWVCLWLTIFAHLTWWIITSIESLCIIFTSSLGISHYSEPQEVFFPPPAFWQTSLNTIVNRISLKREWIIDLYVCECSSNSCNCLGVRQGKAQSIPISLQ